MSNGLDFDDNFSFNTDFEMDSGIDTSSIENTDTNYFEFNNTEQAEPPVSDKKAIMKTVIVCASVGVIGIFTVFALMRGCSAVDKNVISNPQSKSSTNTLKSSTSDFQKQNNRTEDTQWNKFETANGIKFNTDYIEAVYTVTDIKHYVKVVNSEGDISVKTVTTGNISGFVGNYELEIPYYKGSQLSEGISFSVYIQFGKFNDKKVIGEIKY